MDSGLGLREPLKHGFRARTPRGREARSVDQDEDFGEVSMRMPMVGWADVPRRSRRQYGVCSVLGGFSTVLGGSPTVLGVIVIVPDTVMRVLVHREFRRGDTGAEHARGVPAGGAKRQTAGRLRRLVARQAGSDQRAD